MAKKHPSGSTRKPMMERFEGRGSLSFTDAVSKNQLRFSITVERNSTNAPSRYLVQAFTQ